MPLIVAELVVRNYLAGQFLDARVVTETPADLADVVPLIEVSRFGGGDDVYTLDVANIDVFVYHSDLTSAFEYAERVRTNLRLHAEGQEVNGALIAQVSTMSPPIWNRGYINRNVRSITASYRIAIRSIP